MTQTVHTKFTLETREGSTLTDQKIAASNYPVYIDNDKLFELRPVGTTLKGFGIDPDTLFDVDGPKETGEIFDIGNGAFDQSLNTTDSPTFVSLTIGGNSIQVFGAILDDFNTLGAPASDGQFIVATGTGVFAYESGNTARTSLGVGTGDSPVFTGLTVGGIDIPTDVAANTSKVTNATHTGEVTGATVLTVDSTAISNKTLKAVLDGTEEMLINDAGTLKKTTPQNIADLGMSEGGFGSEFEKFESLAQSNTGSSTLQSKVDATTAIKPAGTYRIQFTTEATNSSGGNSTSVEFSIDGVTTSNHANGADFFEVAQTNGNDWGSVSLVVYKILASPATIDLDIKFANSSGTTARVFNSIIEIWRVS